MIEVNKKQDCCGCTACATICPQKCIEMKWDEEGFLYPFVDISRCTHCNACDKVCPIKNPVIERKVDQKGFLIQNLDDEIRKESTSGGAFTAIAISIINKGGVVFGAAYDAEFSVHHIYVECIEELRRFRNSKYVQSELGDSFKYVKNFLLDGRWVCFSGTPCQIEGLSKYLGKKYEKLVLIDVVCHGISSPMVWKKYLEFMRIKEKDVDNICFRDKYYGYKYSTMSLIKGNQNIYHAGSHQDPMLRAFFSDMCDRPSCYKCLFKKRYRVSDITIWDCFSVYDFDENMDDDRGTTRVLCHSEKGAQIIDEIKDEVRYLEVTPEKLIRGVREMFESVKMNSKREQFFKDVVNLDVNTLFNKYYPITLKIKTISIVRYLLLKCNMYKYAKKMLNKINGR